METAKIELDKTKMELDKAKNVKPSNVTVVGEREVKNFIFNLSEDNLKFRVHFFECSPSSDEKLPLTV